MSTLKKQSCCRSESLAWTASICAAAAVGVMAARHTGKRSAGMRWQGVYAGSPRGLRARAADNCASCRLDATIRCGNLNRVPYRAGQWTGRGQELAQAPPEVRG